MLETDIYVGQPLLLECELFFILIIWRKFIVAFMMLTVFCVDAETTYIFFGRWVLSKVLKQTI